MELLIALALLFFGIRFAVRKFRAAHAWLGEDDNLVDDFLPRVSFILLLGVLVWLMTL